MSASDGRDRPALTLLIQLFGREVLDRLARAGYGDESSIAAAGPDRLATASGVSLPLAQRIVAVVREARGSSAVAVRAPRAGRRRQENPTEPARKRPEPRVEAVPAKADPDAVDPFVDDVALVTWMGFTSRTSSGRLSFSVADRILDPVRPEPPEIGDPSPSTATPAADTRPAPRAQDDRPRRTLPGSFWSFGTPATPPTPPDEDAPRTSGTKTPRHDTPPRRNRDDH